MKIYDTSFSCSCPRCFQACWWLCRFTPQMFHRFPSTLVLLKWVRWLLSRPLLSSPTLPWLHCSNSLLWVVFVTIYVYNTLKSCSQVRPQKEKLKLAYYWPAFQMVSVLYNCKFNIFTVWLVGHKNNLKSSSRAIRNYNLHFIWFHILDHWLIIHELWQKGLSSWSIIKDNRPMQS